ncbi:hypothetical protein IHE49_11640 [Rhodanobacter sp. 7MK24]|uniref:hypothetical protein n=1 Tax=Rhodanobacter sp. 7MK24 TaxID=2775922 RepID=UPI00177AD7FA|nr:hypothetical protein [Rhodanobacter sp. 7MK24]MBD8881132.1 hypothetical protein [Rhodanobacter sp. 7MK24]
MRLNLPSPRRFRHPLARALSLLVGVAVVGVLLVFGLALAGVLLLGGGVWLAWRQWRRPRMPATSATQPGKPAPEVLEGEFVVIRQGPVAH